MNDTRCLPLDDGLSSTGKFGRKVQSAVVGRVRDIAMSVCARVSARTRVPKEAKLEERDWYLRP